MKAVSTKTKLQALSSKQSEWKSLPAKRKLEYLESIYGRLMCEEAKRVLRADAKASCKVMGLPEDGTETRAEAAFLTLLLAFNFAPTLEWLIKSYKVLAEETKPMSHVETFTRSNGQIAAKVFPLLPSEYFGPMAKGEGFLFLDPKLVVKETDVRVQQPAEFLLNAPEEGAIVVLGAGNHVFLTMQDCFHSLFCVGSVVLVKHHQLRPYLEETMRYLLGPLFETGYIDTQQDTDFDRQIFYSDPALISKVHMTGGKATHDAIVWGAGNGSRNEPKLKVPMTSELGCVTPWIITPYSYSMEELRYQQRLIADSLRSNASSNCNAPKVVLVADSWPQKAEYLEGIKRELREHLVVPAYYPGSRERWQSFREEYPDATEIEPQGADAKQRALAEPLNALPWLVIELEIDTTKEGNDKQEYALRNEPFCPVVTFVTVKGSQDQGEFCRHATEICNEIIFGSLSATVIVPTNKLSEPAVEKCVDDLRYGAVAVNYWSAVTYGLKTLVWGAFPGESLKSIESGIGQIHNLMFVPNVQKCVFRHPCIGDPMMIEPDLENRATFFTVIVDLLLTPSLATFYGLLQLQAPAIKYVFPAVVLVLFFVLFRNFLWNV